MADLGAEFSFFQGIHARINIRIDMSISVRPITTKFGKQVYGQDLTQMRPIKQLLVMSSRQDHNHLHYQSAYGYQTWQDGNWPW